jgi:hypothetical protein
LARNISETRFITLIDAAVPFIQPCAALGGTAPQAAADCRLLIAINPTRSRKW